MGQRFTSALLVVILAVFGILVGESPDTVKEMVIELAAPVAAILGTLFYFTERIQNRVKNGEIEPGDLLPVFKSKEAGVLVGVSILFVVQRVFGLQISEADQETLIGFAVTMVGTVSTLVMRSYTERGNGEKPPDPDQGSVPSVENLERSFSEMFGVTD